MQAKDDASLADELEIAFERWRSGSAVGKEHFACLARDNLSVIVSALRRQQSGEAVEPSPPVEPSPADVERVARAVAESCHVDLSVAIHEAGGITKAIAIFGMDGISDDPRFKDWRIPSCRGVMQTAHAAIAALSTKEEGLVEELATLDVFLAAYTHHPDGEVLASAIDPTDDLLTLGQLRRILAALEAQASRIAELEAHLREHNTFIVSRIQDGRDMGATVWRLALEDILRENRALLGDREG